MYLLWQAGFLLATELLLADKLRADPTLVTSVRWCQRIQYKLIMVHVVRYLAQDKKNGMHQLTKRVMRRLGVMAPQEDFDSEQLKSKVIFQIVQGVYSIAVCLPTMWLYSSYYLRLAEAILIGLWSLNNCFYSVLYICFIYLWCIWRGATYYIEVIYWGCVYDQSMLIILLFLSVINISMLADIQWKIQNEVCGHREGGEWWQPQW